MGSFLRCGGDTTTQCEYLSTLLSQRVSFANQTVRKLWPYASAALEASLKKVLDQHKPPFLTQLGLSEVDLGPMAPLVAGVKYVDSRDDEVAELSKQLMVWCCTHIFLV